MFNHYHNINVIPSDCVHSLDLIENFLLEGVTPKTPISLNTTEDIGVYEVKRMSRIKYVKIEPIEKPLSIRRNKAWSFKSMFSNTYRGKQYRGNVEFYINEPHPIDLEQSWFEPLITVRFHSGMDAVAEFTWEQFADTEFFNMIDNPENLLRTYIYIRNNCTTIRTDIIEGES